MSTRTFEKLSPEKKEKITHAALREFSAHDFNEGSITNIVRDAEISRGSFYQYFENKDKLYEYLIRYLYAKHRQEMLDIMIKNSGNLYDSLIEFYNFHIDEIIRSDYFSFYKNTFLYANHYLIGKDGIFSLSNQNSDRAVQQSQFLEVINMDNLSIASKEEALEHLYFAVNVLHQMIIDGFVNDVPIDEIKAKTMRAVNWLYYGIQKR